MCGPWQVGDWLGDHSSKPNLSLLLPPASLVEVIDTVMSVCLSVSVWAISRLNRLTYGNKISTGVDLDDISAEFDGQGHRSKFEVTRSKTWFPRLSDLRARIWNTGLWNDNMMLCDIIWHHGMRSWHHATSQHDNSQWGAGYTATM